MKARYIGKDGSRGFENGRIYHIKTDIQRNWLWVYDNESKKRYCPYTNLEKMLENWELLQGD